MQTFLACVAVAVAAGAWFTIRWAEENQRIERTLVEWLLTVDLRDESEIEQR